MDVLGYAMMWYGSAHHDVFNSNAMS